MFQDVVIKMQTINYTKIRNINNVQTTVQTTERQNKTIIPGKFTLDNLGKNTNPEQIFEKKTSIRYECRVRLHQCAQNTKIVSFITVLLLH